MEEELKPKIQHPGEDVIGPSSPVQKALRFLGEFFQSVPMPDLNNKVARDNAMSLAVHLLHLLKGCGMLNLNGFHSPAATLLRSLEDALDCFAAVVLVPGAGEQWSNGKMRPSDAARAWTPLVHNIVARNKSLSDYRRELREEFNDYAHCSSELCAWNLYFQPKMRETDTGAVTGTLELNFRPLVISTNAHSLDAHLVAHTLEWLIIIRQAYRNALNDIPHANEHLDSLQSDIVEIMEGHDKHNCQLLRPPPEVRQLKK